MKTKKEIKVQCAWCGQEKSEKDYLRISRKNGVSICKDCVEEKYTELLKKTDKNRAIMICCHYLNIPYYHDIVNRLEIGEGIRIYFRYLNLAQYDNVTFEDGVISDLSLYDEPIAIKREKVKKRIDEIIEHITEELEMVKNDV